jgi:hypothetical protein
MEDKFWFVFCGILIGLISEGIAISIWYYKRKKKNKKTIIMEIGDNVQIIKSCPTSINETGDIGVITEVSGSGVRVHAEGKENSGNWEGMTHLNKIN